MAFDLEKRKIYSSESRQSTSGDACIQLSIYGLKPAVKLCNRWTTPLSRIPSRIHLFSGKIISFAALKKTGINVEVTQLDEKIIVRLSRQFEMVNWKAYRKDRNLLQNNPNSHGYLGKKSQCFGMHCSQNISVHTFALGIKSSPSESLMDELHEPFEDLILHVIRNTASNKNRSTVYIWCYLVVTDFQSACVIARKLTDENCWTSCDKI